MNTYIYRVVEILSPKITDGDKLNTLKITDGVSQVFVKVPTKRHKSK